MNALIELLTTGLLQSLILALLALGVGLPFRLLNLPDLSAEGAYPLGGVLCGTLLLWGWSPLLATIIASAATGMIGIGIALVHLRFRVNSLLAGIIMSTMAYSVNLRLMGKPNISLFGRDNLFQGMSHGGQIMVLMLVVLSVVAGLWWFLHTEKGLRLRAVGLNPSFARRHHISQRAYTMLGLFLGSALAGSAGSLIVQLQSYADIGMGFGIVIHGLAALMLGEIIVGTTTLTRQLLAPVIGALVYQQIQGLALLVGLAPSDLKLMTGILVLAAIMLRGSR